MLYALLGDDGQVVKYPYGLADLKKDNPNVSFPRNFPVRPEDLEPYNMVAVLDPDPVTYDPGTQLKNEGDLLQTAQGYKRQYVVRSLTLDELHGRCDYLNFWDALLISSVYQTVRAQALTTPGVLVACTELVAALGDAKAGRANVPAIQACINYLLAAGTFTEAELLELQQLFDTFKLSAVYQLGATP